MNCCPVPEAHEVSLPALVAVQLHTTVRFSQFLPTGVLCGGREPYPGIHEYYWETPQQLAVAVLSGYRAIEPGVPGRETHLVRSLARGVGGFGKMPLQGPFLSNAELEEIVAWIDAGMPEGPPADTTEGG